MSHNDTGDDPQPAVSKQSTSYSVFRDIDDAVSKPVVGSDGASSWQAFRACQSKKRQAQGGSVAPQLPMKRRDVKNTGFRTFQEERQHEDELRLAQGDRKVGSGYTVFSGQAAAREEAEARAEEKRKRQVLERIRPDHVRYFIASPTFAGFKLDYVFTTRPPRGTGYYWDGTDSRNRELKRLTDAHVKEWRQSTMKKRPRDDDDDADNEEEATAAAAENTLDDSQTGKNHSHDKHNDNNDNDVQNWHPMQQLQYALQRQQQKRQHPDSFTTTTTGGGGSWKCATDPSSQKVYYYHEKTGERSWKLPSAHHADWESAVDPSSQRVYYYHRSTGERSWDPPITTKETNKSPNDDSNTTTIDANNKREVAFPTVSTSTKRPLPEGWVEATDPKTKKTYYVHSATQQVRWKRPSMDDDDDD